MKIITSRDNQIYKAAYKLLKRKYRDETGRYLLEGKKPIVDAVSLGVDIENIFVCRGFEADFAAFEDDMTVLEVDLFKRLADTGTSQGIIAVSRKKAYGIEDIDRILRNNDKNVVVLDRLQDPGNIGTIIRTAEAAGYCGVLVMQGCADVYSPKVVRAAAGSLFRMPVIYAGTYEETIYKLKKMNRRLVATSLDAEMFYYEVDLSENTALVIGNEGRGISRDFLKNSDIKIKIPMEGDIESLNAAVAAGILMYQSYNKK